MNVAVAERKSDATGKSVRTADGAIDVLHRDAKQGIGAAYVAGFARALSNGATEIIQMDADGSHDPKRLTAMISVLTSADLVIGSRYVRGGAVRNWSVLRRLTSRGGSLFAGLVLRLSVKDLTGGYKAWRRDTLEQIPWDRVHPGGYVFQIETTFRASRANARIVEIPVVFEDRRVGSSKMSNWIVLEAFVIVIRLRWNELRGRL